MEHNRNNRTAVDQLMRKELPVGQEQPLQPYLARIRRRMRLRDGLLLAQRSLWMAGLLSLLVLLAGRIWPIEQPWRWALIPLGLWLVILLGYTLFRPLSSMRVALQADAELHLKERLSTSLALTAAQTGSRPQLKDVFASFEPHLVQQAHADALHAARQVDPARDFPIIAQRRALSAVAGILVAALLLVYLPNPMDKIIAERKEVAREAQRQAAKVEEMRKQVENAKEMSPEEREELLRKLDELAKQLRANKGDREQAMADVSKLEESLRQKLDPKGGQRQAALEAMAAQLQAMAKQQNPQIGDLQAAADAMKKLADQLESMTPEERKAAAQQLSQMASRAAQAGDGNLAQALASLAQAAQSNDAQAMQDAAKRASDALSQAKSDLANQRTFSQTLSQLQNSRQAMAQSGQSSQRAQGQGQSQSQGQGQGQGQGNQPGQGGQNGNNPGQGQGQGQVAGGGGTSANSLPPANRTGRAGSPTGPGKGASTGSNTSSQVYVPREKLNASSGNQVFVPGQDTNQGETQTKEQKDPMGGISNPALVPYNEVYQSYRDSANQAMDQSYIPPSMKDYIKAYFSQLEP